MYRIPLSSEDFPGWVGRLPANLEFTKVQLLWAAITVGRPSKQSVRHHGQYARFEMLYRWNMVQAALDFSSRHRWVFNSPAFQQFDPSEKGAINYFLGMVFVKLAASKFLSMPWLIHADLFERGGGNIGLVAGRSCADLIGFDPASNRYGVFEAKGRNSGYTDALIEKAKSQAQNVETVNGDTPALRVASCLYRHSIRKQLRFYWEDPPGDERAERFQLHADGNTWRQYYWPVQMLADRCADDAVGFAAQFGFIVKLRPEVVRLMKALNEPGDGYLRPLQDLWTWSAKRASEQIVPGEELWNGDGIGLQIVHEDRITQ